jgi:glucokinase
MSYSFNLVASSKNAAKLAVQAKVAETAQMQPCHAIDVNQATEAAYAFISLLPEDETKDVYVAMAGYVSGDWSQGELLNLSGVSLNINVQHIARTVQA